MSPKALIALAVSGLGVALAGPRLRPSSAQPAPGIVTPEGRVRKGRVLLDLTHPFAGMTLHFAVRVIGIDAPAAR